jgi:hypothetical protein
VIANEADHSSNIEVSKFVRAGVLLVFALNRYLEDVLKLEAILETQQEIKDVFCLDLILRNVPVKLKIQYCRQRVTKMKPREYGGTLSPAFRMIALGLIVIHALFVEQPQNGRHLGF